MRTLILGLGNPILTDDGVGVHVAESVREALPAEAPVEVRQVSLGGLTLMERMVGYDRVILIDAFVGTGQDSSQAGSVHRLSLSELQAVGATEHSSSPHDTNLVTALETGRRMGLPLPEEIIIYAVEVENVTEFGEEPTAAVARAIPQVTVAVLEELKEREYDLT